MPQALYRLTSTRDFHLEADSRREILALRSSLSALYCEAGKCPSHSRNIQNFSPVSLFRNVVFVLSGNRYRCAPDEALSASVTRYGHFDDRLPSVQCVY